MTNPPSGGSASTEFGATTLSGKTTAAPREDGPPPGSAHAPSGSTARDGGNGHTTRTDLPRVEDHPSSPVGTVPSSGTDDAPGAATGAAAAIRGIRTGRNRGPRRARLQIRHINPVTVLKFSCVLSIALFFVWLIIVGVLFGILDAAGVINNINDTVTQLRGDPSKPPITGGIVFGGAAIIGVVNIVLFIALTTIGAVIYNLCADLVGGIEITLSER